jgi:hypothetical protein
LTCVSQATHFYYGWMSKRDRLMSPAGTSSGRGGRDSPNRVSLLQRLLQAFPKPSLGGEAQRFADSLMPAGRRSGVGTRSIEPYLEAARTTRPGPLE